jgi:integrase
MLYKRPKSPFYWLAITHDGKRYRESTGLADKAEAQRYHDEFKAGLWKQKRQLTTWDKAVDKWVSDGDRSIQELSFLRQVGDIARVSPDAFRHVLEGKSNSTYNKYRGIILAVCRLSGIDLELQKKKVPRSHTRFISKDEWELLCYHLPDHLKTVCTFAVQTGLRRGNILGLTWDRVDLDRRVLWIDAPEMKADKAHGIPLSSNAVALLRQLWTTADKKEPHVFLYKGKRMKAVKSAFTKACDRAGLPGFTFHMLRHTWASWHVMNGTSLMALKELGAWSDLQMVNRYAHLSPEHLRQWADNSVPFSVTKQRKTRVKKERNQHTETEELDVSS